MPNIFISYRRGDSAGHSGRLFDALQRRFGAERLFRDLEDLEPGVNFPEALGRALSQCDVMLAMIGPTWASASGSSGRRLEQKDDFVRLEVATGLARNDVRVIPVLVNGATMPLAVDLPEDLKALQARNAFELSDSRWDYDVNRLGDTLAKLLKIPEPLAATPGNATLAAELPSSSARNTKMVVGGVLLVLAIGAWFAFTGGDQPAPTGESPAAAVASDLATAGSSMFKVGALNWTTDDGNRTTDWNGAVALCAKLKLGDESWRLPTIRELGSIYDPKDSDPFGNKVMRPFHSGMRANWFWSSDKDTATAAFAFDFKSGEPISLAVNFNSGAHALCVSP